MSTNRVERINSEIQKIMGNLISTEINDPQLKGQIISVVGVRTSSDLSHAKVFISILENDQKQLQLFERIKKAQNFLQRRLAEELNLRKCPELTLVYDESIEQGQNILNIIKTLNKDKK